MSPQTSLILMRGNSLSELELCIVEPSYWIFCLNFNWYFKKDHGLCQYFLGMIGDFNLSLHSI